MMGGVVRSCLQILLKLVNMIMGIVGIAMILYGLWMVRVWQREMAGSSYADFFSTSPWFIYAFFGIGITFCMITCTGHMAADTAHGHCLFCFTLIMFVILLLETAMAADIFLNSDWEKDLPEDPTGRLKDFMDFVGANFDICQWIGFVIVLAQGLSVLLAVILRTFGPDRGAFYDSDDEYIQARLPLINHHVQPLPYVVGDPQFGCKNDAWSRKVYEKTTK